MARPRDVKPSWAMSSVVTSTMVVAEAVVEVIPWRTAARAPMTKPPRCEKGSSSEPESRTTLAQMKTPHRRRGAPASSRNHAEPSRKNGAAE